ncbi:alpha/beta fold hydrolase [Streptomyces oceani]|uniref:alpha/beta fold hydrolase n=1 Tax=Streptomyces oceani TaxID=1075402 RepID=UPI00147D6763|nr:alpha/beta fold hydrolase [Streptomyces oceani]
MHGGPGYPSDVPFEAFEPLAREREIIWNDQLGVGRSDPIEDPSLLTVNRFLDELGAVIEGLDLESPHVYGHSWGAMLEEASLRRAYVEIVQSYLARIEARPHLTTTSTGAATPAVNDSRQS